MNKLFLIIVTLLLFQGCTSVFFQPNHVLYYSPDQFKIDFKSVYFKSNDKINLHGWYLINKQKLKKPKGLIVQFHGNSQNMSSHVYSLAWLTDYGYDVFTFDYRGYGTSYFKYNKDTMVNDSVAALKKAYQLKIKNNCQKLILYGQSLGGNMLANAYSKFPYKEKVNLLVFDSTFMNYKKVASQTLRRSWITYLFSPITYLLISNKYKTNNIIRDIKTKTLVIHSRSDHVVPYSNGLSLFNTLKHKNKHIWSLNKTHHIGIFNSKKSTLRDRFLKYISKN